MAAGSLDEKWYYGRWNGVECRAVHGGSPRIVTLDIHNVDLTGRDLPWESVGQLGALEELNVFNCKLGGPIVSAALCSLTALRVLVLSQVLECVFVGNLKTMLYCR